ncbi:MAG: hypothetical protein Q7S45_01770 [Candidatus Curtissbacteria bacterium]|nr:hypothetical protein [Candidatus Curtissbacteria bacterium]
MLSAILAIIIILWFLGYVPNGVIHIPNIELISINNYQITLWNVLILLAVGWAIGILPKPFREIASILLLFWILSTIGILQIAGLSNIFIIAIILSLAFYIFQGASRKE